MTCGSGVVTVHGRGAGRWPRISSPTCLTETPAAALHCLYGRCQVVGHDGVPGRQLAGEPDPREHGDSEEHNGCRSPWADD
jgi:hypothetical protein